MKLKRTALLLSIVLIMLFVIGCGDSKAGTGTETTAAVTGAETSGINSTDLKANAYDNYNLAEYVTLGQYKAVTIAKQDLTVTDQQYNDFIAAKIQENTTNVEVTDRAVQSGDKVKINYVGKMTDIETPDGMTADDQEIVIGSGSFIPGFEEGLIGAKKGDVVTLNINFPDPYTNNADLSGKPVTFTVTVNGIYNDVIPEMNDDFVKTISDFNTVDEYKSSVMLDLYAENEKTARTTQIGELWNKIIAGSVIIKYPETETTAYSTEMIDYYTNYASTNGYESLETMLTTLYSTTLEDFNKEAVTYAQSTVAEEMILYSIVKADNLYLTQEEYEAGAATYATQYEFDTVTALEEYYGKDVLVRSILWDKTLDYLLEQAVVA